MKALIVGAAFAATLACVFGAASAFGQGTLGAPLDGQAIYAMLLSAIQSKNWAALVAIGVVAIVWAIRKFDVYIPGAGPKIDAFFNTKLGGWLLNFATVAGTAIAATTAAGKPITWAMFGLIFGGAASSAGILELLRDLWEFVQGVLAKGTSSTVTVPGGSASDTAKKL